MFEKKLLLASQSPRRADILRAVGWPFEVMAAAIDETRAPNEDPVTYVERLALTKAQTVAAAQRAPLVLGADTAVIVDDEILGQPRDRDDARRMLELLSDRWHDVLTGVALVAVDDSAGSRTLVSHERTRVKFCPLSESDIDWYIGTGESMGKAGAYGIQGAAAIFIAEIQGDYFNIVGLPIRLVLEMAQQI